MSLFETMLSGRERYAEALREHTQLGINRILNVSSAIPAETKEGKISQEYFMARVNKTGSCWLWTGSLDRKGYGKAHFWNGKRRRYRLAHRVSYEMFVGTLEPGMLVCHHCDTPGCVNPQHLFLGTSADNVLDAALKDRLPNKKLTVSQVKEIRREIESGVGYDELAKRFGVKPENIRRIHKRDSWTFIEAEPQQPMCRYPDLVEGSSPCADLGTAGVSGSSNEIWLAQLRRRLEQHELFVGNLLALLEAEQFDDAMDMVRDEQRAMHGRS